MRRVLSVDLRPGDIFMLTTVIADDIALPVDHIDCGGFVISNLKKNRGSDVTYITYSGNLKIQTFFS